jgi:hypothetical protein
LTAPSDAYTPPRGLVRVVRAGGRAGGGREKRERGRERQRELYYADRHITDTQ